MRFKWILLIFCSMFTISIHAAKSSFHLSLNGGGKHCIENTTRGSLADPRVYTQPGSLKKHGCLLQHENKTECKISLCVKLFFVSLGILAASGITTILEFSIIQFTAMFAAIGWFLFGFGMAMAALVLILGVSRII